ncbi:MAG: hypothetical protein QGG48_08925, partial [Desulfatiglandales bacterium]|nr:hypothetical protein [Desulfatiglandales bacterium]
CTVILAIGAASEGSFSALYGLLGGRHRRGRVNRPEFVRLRALPHNSGYWCRLACYYPAKPRSRKREYWEIQP